MLRCLAVLCLCLTQLGNISFESELKRQRLEVVDGGPLKRNDYVVTLKDSMAIDTRNNFVAAQKNPDDPAWSYANLKQDHRAVLLTTFTGTRVIETNIPPESEQKPGESYPVLVEILNGPYKGQFRIIGHNQVVAVKPIKR